MTFNMELLKNIFSDCTIDSWLALGRNDSFTFLGSVTRHTRKRTVEFCHSSRNVTKIGRPLERRESIPSAYPAIYGVLRKPINLAILVNNWTWLNFTQKNYISQELFKTKYPCNWCSKIYIRDELSSRRHTKKNGTSFNSVNIVNIWGKNNS